MEKIIVTFEQGGKKAVADMEVKGKVLNIKLDFEPGLDRKTDPQTPMYALLAFEFLKFLNKGGKNE